jgi:L-ascorbate metabolism protein UlaG (beta-lactamase superfamily)
MESVGENNMSDKIKASERLLAGIQWLGHASFRITSGVTLYIDPWKLKNPIAADVVLITHGHRDHLSVSDIQRILKPDTIVLCPEASLAQAPGKAQAVAPGQSLQVGGLHIEVVSSYNTNKPNHPREANNVGYIVELDGRRIYHAGDTDLIPEMASIRCDVALLPIGGTYTMNAAEAAEALARIKPQVAVPMHWGDIVGSSKDVEQFRKRAPEGVAVVVLPIEE